MVVCNRCKLKEKVNRAYCLECKQEVQRGVCKLDRITMNKFLHCFTFSDYYELHKEYNKTKLEILKIKMENL